LNGHRRSIPNPGFVRRRQPGHPENLAGRTDDHRQPVAQPLRDPAVDELILQFCGMV